MKNSKSARPWFAIMAVLLSLLIILTGCTCAEPLVDIVIENQTDQVLTIYYAGGGAPLGDIAPGEQITIKRDMNIGEYPITAKNRQGKVVFSQVYSFTTNLERIDGKGASPYGRIYKGVIPPLENGLGSSDNVTSEKLIE